MRTAVGLTASAIGRSSLGREVDGDNLTAPDHPFPRLLVLQLELGDQLVLTEVMLTQVAYRHYRFEFRLIVPLNSAHRSREALVVRGDNRALLGEHVDIFLEDTAVQLVPEAKHVHRLDFELAELHPATHRDPRGSGSGRK